MQVTLSQGRAEKVVVVLIAVGVVVAMNEPDIGRVEDWRKFDFKRTLCLQVTQKHDGIGSVLVNDLQHMFEMTVGVAKEIDHVVRGSGKYILCLTAA